MKSQDVFAKYFLNEPEEKSIFVLLFSCVSLNFCFP